MPPGAMGHAAPTAENVDGANAGGACGGCILVVSRSGVHTGATGMACAADGGDANIATGVAASSRTESFADVRVGLANESSTSGRVGAGTSEREGGATVRPSATTTGAASPPSARGVFSAALAAALARRVDVSVPSASRDVKATFTSLRPPPRRRTPNSVSETVLRSKSEPEALSKSVAEPNARSLVFKPFARASARSALSARRLFRGLF